MNREKLILLLLSAINFTHIMDFMIMMPLGPQFKRVFDLDPSQWSLLVSSYTFAAAISGLASVFLIDRFDRKKALLFLYAGFAVGTFLVGLSPTYGFLLLARSITGLFGGVIGAVVMAIVGDLIPNERRGRAMGVIMAGFSAAASLGVPFGLYLGTKFSWHIPFFVISGLSAFLFILSLFSLPTFKAHIAEGIDKPRKLDGFRNILGDKNQQLALLFMGTLLFGHFTIIPFISPYMVSNVGFREMDLTWIYFIGGVVSIISSPLVGKAADRWGRLRVFIVLLFISMIPVWFITNLWPMSVFPVIIITSLFFFSGGGRMIPANAIVIGTAPARYRGSFMSIRSSVQNLVSGLAAYAGGLIVIENADGQYENYHLVGYLAIGMALLSILVIRKIVDKY